MPVLKCGCSVIRLYLFWQCLLQCSQGRVGVAGVGLKALDSFPQTSQLLVLILQLLQQILDLQEERQIYQSETSAFGVKTITEKSVTTGKGEGKQRAHLLQGRLNSAPCWAVFLWLTSCRWTGGRITPVIVFSGLLFDQYRVKNTHTQRHKHEHKTLPAGANKTLADAGGVGRWAMKLKRSTN